MYFQSLYQFLEKKETNKTENSAQSAGLAFGPRLRPAGPARPQNWPMAPALLVRRAWSPRPIHARGSVAATGRRRGVPDRHDGTSGVAPGRSTRVGAH
jgi:hypothetical protein